MEININRENLSVCKAVCHTKSSFAAECDIIVPDSKPDIAKILQLSARACVTSCETQSDRIIISGNITFNVIYLADNEEKNVCAVSATCMFSDLFRYNGIQEDMLTAADVTVNDLSYDLADCRKLTAKASLCGKIRIYSCTDVDVVSSIDNARTKTETVNSTVIRSFAEGTAEITDSFELSSGKMSISEILKADAKITDSDIKVIDDKAIIKGSVSVVTLYTSDGEIDYIESEMPFAHVIDAENIRSNMMVEYDVSINDLRVSASPDVNGDTRILDIEAELFFRIIARENISCKCVTDAFVPHGSLEVEKGVLSVSSVESTVHNEVNFKELIELPENIAPIDTVYEIMARPFAENCEIIGDKLKISGYTEVYILYLSNESSSPVFSYKTNLDFSVVIDSPDCTLTPVSECKLKSISYVISSERSLEIRGSVIVTTQCMRMKETEYIKSAEEGVYSPPKRPSVTVSYVTDGTSLWDIAKEYNISENDILSANAIESEDDMKVGTALIIPK